MSSCSTLCEFSCLHLIPVFNSDQAFEACWTETTNVRCSGRNTFSLRPLEGLAPPKPPCFPRGGGGEGPPTPYDTASAYSLHVTNWFFRALRLCTMFDNDNQIFLFGTYAMAWLCEKSTEGIVWEATQWRIFVNKSRCVSFCNLRSGEMLWNKNTVCLFLESAQWRCFVKNQGLYLFGAYEVAKFCECNTVCLFLQPQSWRKLMENHSVCVFPFYNLRSGEHLWTITACLFLESTQWRDVVKKHGMFLFGTHAVAKFCEQSRRFALWNPTHAMAISWF